MGDMRDRDEDVVELNGELAMTRERAEKLETEVGQLEHRVGEMRAEVEDLRSEYTSRNESCTEAELQLENLTALLHVARGELVDTRNQLSVLHQQLDSADVQLADLRGNLSVLEGEMDILEDEKLELNRSLSLARERLDSLQYSIGLGGEIHRRFEWFYLGEKSFSVGKSGQRGSGFNRTEYLEIATGNHIEDTEYDRYIEVVDFQVGEITEIADYLYGGGATDIQRANNILKFVQYLPYIHDCDGNNYVRHPLETLVEGGGDCEDTSVLAAALMRAAGPEGFPVVLLSVDTNSDDEADHMMVGIDVEGATGKSYEYGDVDYYLCETTSSSYRVGQKPGGYEVIEAIMLG
jgi:hypothetical protein